MQTPFCQLQRETETKNSSDQKRGLNRFCVIFSCRCRIHK